MDIYSGFAYCYDEFMKDIPYDEWAEYLKKILNNAKINDGLICELGSGTGEITMRLRNFGFDMIGVDASEDMLMVAQDKMYDAEISDIMYLHQDFRSLELYGTVRAFVSVCDSLNYVTEYEDLVDVFKLVNNYLDKDGLFVFDLKTDYFYKTEYADNSFSEKHNDYTLNWNNHYDEANRLNHYNITVDFEEGNYYDEVEEEHIQKAYTVEEIIEAIKSSGMELLNVYDALTFDEPSDTSKRIYFVAKEGFQPGKLY